MSPSSVNLRSCALTTQSTARNNRQNVKQTARTHAPTHAPARREGTNRRLSPTEINPARIEARTCAVQGSERQFLLVLAREFDIDLCARSNKLRGQGEGEDVAFHGELEINRCTSRGPRQGRRDSAVRDLLSLRGRPVIDNWCRFALSFRRPCTVANHDGFINYVLPFSIASLGMPFIFSKL
uniref:Uncharacterized protein n=1 Tax=Oryza meridionalis TaxID=40149 RepID=A0A0E0ED77_9ORYZ